MSSVEVFKELGKGFLLTSRGLNDPSTLCKLKKISCLKTITSEVLPRSSLGPS